MGVWIAVIFSTTFSSIGGFSGSSASGRYIRGNRSDLGLLMAVYLSNILFGILFWRKGRAAANGLLTL